MVKKLRKTNRVKHNTELLIDGENIRAKKAGAIVQAASSQGILHEAKVYGRQKDNSTRNWSDAARKHKISDIRLFGEPGKNKIDNKIMKDARQVVDKCKNVDIVCIATSDKDYVPIIKELRSLGKRVVIIGEKHASVLLRESCSRFILI